MRSRLCRCERPNRALDGDRVAYCERCGELLPDSRDELMAALIAKVDRLGREVGHLTAHETSGTGRG